MNYSLASTRRLGNYFQKIILTHDNTIKAESVSYLNSLKSWHNLFAQLDGNKEHGNINWDSFNELQGDDESNGNTKVSGIVTIFHTYQAHVTMTYMIEIKDVTADNLVDTIRNEFNNISGENITANNNCIVNAVLTLN